MSRAIYLLYVLVFVGFGLMGCAGAGEGAAGEVKELKNENKQLENENAELQQELEDAQQEITEMEEAIASVAAKVSAAASAAASESASASASAEAGAPVPDKECAVGKTCDLGPGSAVIRSIQPTKTLTAQYTSPKSGDFVVVEFDYTYQGNTGVTLDEPQWLLEDASGNVYSYDFDLTLDYSGLDNDIIYAELQPGVAQAGKIVYQVAPDADDFTLYINDLALPQEGEIASVDM